MDASIVELRYNMADVLKALERRESVRITHRGRVKGTIHPPEPDRKPITRDHPFFSLRKGENQSVEAEMARLRKERYDDL